MLIGIASISLSACAKKEVVECAEVDVLTVRYGSAYIGCEMEPYFIKIDDLSLCSTVLPTDSIYSSNWIPGCQMLELQSDSLNGDFRIRYLQGSGLQIDAYNPGLIISDWEFMYMGRAVDTDEFPYHGAYSITSENLTINVLMLNRYIGGCFHDEFIWQIIE